MRIQEALANDGVIAATFLKELRARTDKVSKTLGYKRSLAHEPMDAIAEALEAETASCPANWRCDIDWLSLWTMASRVALGVGCQASDAEDIASDAMSETANNAKRVCTWPVCRLRLGRAFLPCHPLCECLLVCYDSDHIARATYAYAKTCAYRMAHERLGERDADVSLDGEVREGGPILAETLAAPPLVLRSINSQGSPYVSPRIVAAAMRKLSGKGMSQADSMALWRYRRSVAGGASTFRQSLTNVV